MKNQLTRLKMYLLILREKKPKTVTRTNFIHIFNNQYNFEVSISSLLNEQEKCNPLKQLTFLTFLINQVISTQKQMVSCFHWEKLIFFSNNEIKLFQSVLN